MNRVKTVLTTAAAVAVAAVAGCYSASATTTATTTTSAAEATHIVVWSVNSDGPFFREILTGAVGDAGSGVTVHPDGTVDPEHTSELELKLSHGSFRLSIASLDSEFLHAVTDWAYDRSTCSIHGTVTGAVPIVAGSGTGAYRGIAGSFTLTLGLDEDWINKAGCNETTPFRAQLILIEGSGSVRR